VSTENESLDTLIRVIRTGEEFGFEMDTRWLAELPTLTVPKSTLDGDTESTAGLEVDVEFIVPCATTPPHPEGPMQRRTEVMIARYEKLRTSERSSLGSGCRESHLDVFAIRES
jgi:hypothetical protein